LSLREGGEVTQVEEGETGPSLLLLMTGEEKEEGK